MGSLDSQTILFLVSAFFVGAGIGFLVHAMSGGRRLRETEHDWQSRYDKALRQIEKLKTQNTALEKTVETNRANAQQYQHAAMQSQTELESLQEKANTLSKNVFTLGTERDQLNDKLNGSQKQLFATQQVMRDLQTEFGKSKEFYTAQLMSAVEQRKLLEQKIDDAKQEEGSLNNLLASARSEHESVNRLLASAQARLDGLEVLEGKVVALEADNAELKHKATLAAREAESLQREARELDELKVQNKELTQCLRSMEDSRKQYESDAQRYKVQYEESEKKSDTLRMKLGDIEQNFVDMQQAKDDARRAGDELNGDTPAFGLSGPDGEADDLTEIVGIGKVFEEMLHELGIFHFRQIAAFGPGDVARINSELKEFRGRIEHDDWIGQAKELHFKKYGSA
jgi:predicted flap endonuclease-1-like 5' DNA nuclease